MNNPVPVIECHGLSRTFDDGTLKVDVLTEVNLLVNPGEQIAIIGASGSGKSTLLQLLGGLDKPTRGNVLVCGKDINALNEKERSRLRNQTLGFVYQFHHLLPEFTVLENVCMPLLIQGAAVTTAIERATVILDKVGLLPRKEHKLGELSGGERQRAAIARALITNPKCILADEPTGNLDSKTSQRVYQSLLDLNKEFNTSIIIVTHDIRLTRLMDKVYNIENGKLCAMEAAAL